MSRHCATCARSFGDEHALQQHLNSPAHAPRFECEGCDRSFGDDNALQQHLNSPAHAPRFECEECDRSFDDDDALQQHLNSNRQYLPSSPLDMFFLSFTEFDYDPSASPSDEFSRLRRFYGWRSEDIDNRNAWDMYRGALVREFNAWYGADNASLRSWYTLCRALKIAPLPKSCEACRSVSLTVP